MDFTITVAEDRLSATVDCPAGVEVDVPALREMLSANNISFGIERDTLIALTTASDEDRHLLLATGTPPLAGAPGGFDPPLDEALLPMDVKAGQIIGPFVPATAGQDGMGVDGEPIAPPEMIVATIGEGLNRKPDGVVEARFAGTLARDGNGVWTVTLAECVVAVASDGMSATIRARANVAVDEAGVKKFLDQAGVVAGIDWEAAKQLAVPSAEERSFVIAAGRVPVDGVEAVFDFAIKEAERKDEKKEHIDFRETGGYHDVAAGQLLLTMTPATNGEPGTTVTGKVLPSKPGKKREVAEMIGVGANADPADPCRVVASLDGVYKRNVRGQIEIKAELAVNGDVDLHCGNIDTKFPVSIKGDIKTGFSVKSGSSITVGGAIEDARVSARGDLNIRGGILPGKQRVKAHGDVKARFIDKREVKGRCVVVQVSIAGCSISATEMISTKEIVGGKLIATKSVTCDSLGSTSEVLTEIQVGVNPLAQGMYSSLSQERIALTQDAHLKRQRAELIEHKIRLAGKHGRITESDKAELVESFAEREEAQKRLDTCAQMLTVHKMALDQAVELQKTAVVAVRNTAYRGVRIMFGDNELVLTEMMQRPTFTMVDGVISNGSAPAKK
jgi:uncharacterized protein